MNSLSLAHNCYTILHRRTVWTEPPHLNFYFAQGACSKVECPPARPLSTSHQIRAQSSLSLLVCSRHILNRGDGKAILATTRLDFVAENGLHQAFVIAKHMTRLDTEKHRLFECKANTTTTNRNWRSSAIHAPPVGSSVAYSHARFRQQDHARRSAIAHGATRWFEHTPR